MMPNKNIVVLGASPKTHRFSHKAQLALMAAGYNVTPVHPKLDVIGGLKVKQRLSQITENIDTLALYLGEKASTPIFEDIITLKPRRVIFNPGTESQSLELALSSAGIHFVKDCVLVMLREERF